VKLATGPFLPPNPWDGVKFATGPFLPPNPWDGRSA
jgi:hypothetical protein